MAEHIIEFFLRNTLLFGIFPFRMCSNSVQPYLRYYILRKLLLVIVVTGCSYMLSKLGLTVKNHSSFTVFLIRLVRLTWITYEGLEVFIVLSRKTEIQAFLNNFLNFHRSNLNFKNDQSFQKRFKIIMFFVVSSHAGLILFACAIENHHILKLNNTMYVVGTMYLVMLCLFFVLLVEVTRSIFESFIENCDLDMYPLVQKYTFVRSFFQNFLRLFGELLLLRVFTFFLVATLNVYITMYKENRFSKCFFYDLANVQVIISLVICNRFNKAANAVS